MQKKIVNLCVNNLLMTKTSEKLYVKKINIPCCSKSSKRHNPVNLMLEEKTKSTFYLEMSLLKRGVKRSSVSS